MERARPLKPWRVGLAALALVGAVAALLAAAAQAPGSTPGALVAGGSGVAVAALAFSVWEWSFHRYLYHRDHGGLLRPLFLTHHRDHHFVYFPPYLDTEANANFLLPLADWLFGTLRLPEPGADVLAVGRAMAPLLGGRANRHDSALWSRTE